jgi:hypothetical protein
MENQGNMSPPKFNNFTIMDSNDSEMDKIPNINFKRMIIRKINEIKENK